MSIRDSPGVDEGGIAQLAKTLNLNDSIGEMGSWAAIMQEEQMNLSPKEDENEEEHAEDSLVEGRENDKPVHPRRNLRPPFIIRVMNVPYQTVEEDLFFHFGGKSDVTDMILNRGVAEVEMKTAEAMQKALELDSKYFMGRSIRVRPSPTFNPHYQRNSVRHDSQSSHFSSDSRRDNRYGGRNSYGPHDNNYGTYGSQSARDSYNMPPPGHIPNKRGGRGGYFDGGRGGGYLDRGYQNDGYHGKGQYQQYRNDRGGRGGYGNQRGGSHTDRGYDRDRKNDHYDDRSLQRSSSHQFDQRYERPGSVSSYRSRTDSVSSHMTNDRRNDEVSSASQVKKPSIFGDAKPVDTSVKEMEIEKKILKDRELIHQQAEAERQERLAAAASHVQVPSSGPVPINQHHQSHYSQHHNQTRHQANNGQSGHINYEQRHQGYRKSHDSISANDLPHLERKTSSPFDGPPGGVHILQRTTPKDDTSDVHSDSSPPLDPVHPPVPQDEIKKEVLTFTRTNPLQKSSTAGNIAAESASRGVSARGAARGASSRGTRGGRGSYHVERGERRASIAEGPHKAPKGGVHKQYQDRKESVFSRGTGESKRGGRGGGKRSVEIKNKSRKDEAIKREDNKEKVDEQPSKSSVKSEQKRDSIKEIKEKVIEEKSVKEDSKSVEKNEAKKEEKCKKDGEGEKKKKGSQGEVGAKKKKEEEKKKLQAMPTLKTVKPSFQTANKYAALMDAD